MGQLTVYFVGICTHFLAEEPKNDHRVILVNAEHDPDHPHKATLSVRPEDILVGKVPSTLGGVTLRVGNVTSELVYHQSFIRCIPSMRRHTEQRIEPDPRVIEETHRELVAARFELIGGELRAGIFKGAATACVTLETDGHPKLVITDFNGSTASVVLLSGANVWVQNVGAEKGDDEQDFFLHFRTVKPQVVDRTAPTKEELVHCPALQIPDPPDAPGTIGPGCSNSTYP